MRANRLESAIEKVSRVLTRRYGIDVIFRGNNCRTDGRTIYLPSLPDDLPDELLEAVRGWTDHECAHCIFTETGVRSEFEQEHGTRAFSVLNTLEDARVERLMAESYPGSGVNIERAFRFVTRLADGQAPRDPLRAFTCAIYTRATGHPDLQALPEEAYRLVDKCEEELSRLHECSSTSDVAELAARVWEKVAQDLQGVTGGDDREESRPSSEPSLSDDQKVRQEEAGGDASPADPSGPAEDEGKSENGRTCEATDAPEGERSDEDASPMGQLQRHIEGRMQSRRADGTYRVYTREHDVVEVPDTDSSYDWREKVRDLRPQISGLLRRLVHTLRGRQEKRWLRERSRGRLDPGALHKLATGRTDRIFRQRAETDAGATACTLLLDLSSSMAGQQIRICRRLALIFGETLSRLSFPTEIIGFSTVDRDLRAEVIRETGQKREDLARRYSRMVPIYHAILKRFGEPWRRGAARMGNAHTRVLTPMGESLLFAGRRLARRQEKRKVLFCLTDGKPVVGAWDESVTQSHACDAVERLTEAGIEPVGIGIMETSVRKVFPRHAVIHDLDDLASGFARQLCSVLTERTRRTSA